MIPVADFEWSSAKAGSYALAPIDPLCDEAAAADTRVTMRGGQVDFSCVESPMDIECGLLDGVVVEVRMRPPR